MTRNLVSNIEESFNSKLSNFDKCFPTYMGEDDMNMLETLITSARDSSKDEEVCFLKIHI